MRAIDLEKLVRPNIQKLRPYSPARKEFSGEARIFLDANENSLGSPLPGNLNRYPDPLQISVKKALSRSIGLGVEEIFLGNGSDEAIDLLFRVFCEPRTDNIIICPPTYGMYEVSADINDVETRRVPLTDEFELDVAGTLKAVDEQTKIIFICSPNNPTGNVMRRDDVITLLESFDGLVVVDEAYIHFSGVDSILDALGSHRNLVVLQTFSKAWGLAGLRVGAAYADRLIVDLLNRVKPPYNLSSVAQRLILEALEKRAEVDSSIGRILEERERLVEALGSIGCVREIFRTDANFVLVKVTDADSTYEKLLTEGIVVRNRSMVEKCEGGLRITVGTREENDALILSIRGFGK
jgi:histidinol-phosphate aminotransferase